MTTKPNEIYTIVMVDAGPMNNSIEWNHWLVRNIPRNNNELVLTEFSKSSTTKNTCLQRYAFLLFREPGKN